LGIHEHQVGQAGMAVAVIIEVQAWGRRAATGADLQPRYRQRQPVRLHEHRQRVARIADARVRADDQPVALLDGIGHGAEPDHADPLALARGDLQPGWAYRQVRRGHQLFLVARLFPAVQAGLAGPGRTVRVGQPQLGVGRTGRHRHAHRADLQGVHGQGRQRGEHECRGLSHQ